MNRTRSSLFKRPSAVWIAVTIVCACAIMLRSDSLWSDEARLANGTRSQPSLTPSSDHLPQPSGEHHQPNPDDTLWSQASDAAHAGPTRNAASGADSSPRPQKNVAFIDDPSCAAPVANEPASWSASEIVSQWQHGSQQDATDDGADQTVRSNSDGLAAEQSGTAETLAKPAEQTIITEAPPGRASIADNRLGRPGSGAEDAGKARLVGAQRATATGVDRESRAGGSGERISGQAAFASESSRPVPVADGTSERAPGSRTAADPRTNNSPATDSAARDYRAQLLELFAHPESRSENGVPSAGPATIGLYCPRPSLIDGSPSYPARQNVSNLTEQSIKAVRIAQTPGDFSFAPPVIQHDMVESPPDQGDTPQPEWRPYQADEAEVQGPRHRGQSHHLGNETFAAQPPYETQSLVIAPNHSHSKQNLHQPIGHGTLAQGSVAQPAIRQPASRWKPTSPKRRGEAPPSRATSVWNGSRGPINPAASEAKPLLPRIEGTGSIRAAVNESSPASRQPRFAEPAAIGEAGRTGCAAGSSAGDGWVAATDTEPRNEDCSEACSEKTSQDHAPRDAPGNRECTRNTFSPVRRNETTTPVPQSATTTGDISESDADGWSGWGAHRFEESETDRLASSEQPRDQSDRPSGSIPTQPWRLTHVNPRPHLPQRSPLPHPLWERLGGPAVPRTALREESPGRLPSLAEEPLVLARRTSRDGSERRPNRFDSSRIASPQAVAKLRFDISPIPGVPQIKSPRRLTFVMHEASPRIRSPQRLASARPGTAPAPEITSPRRTSSGLRNASPEIRSPRNTSLVSRDALPQFRSPRDSSVVRRGGAPRTRGRAETTSALRDASLRDASPRIRSPQKSTFIQTANNEPTPARLSTAAETPDDIAASERPSADSEDQAEADQQPAAGLQEDQKLGEAPEDTSLRFLRQQTVLLDPGEHELDISIQYLNDKFDFVAVEQQNGGFQVAEAERRQRLLIVPLQLRYGISKYTQAFVNVPFGWSNNEVSFLGMDQSADSGGIGDVSAGIVKQVIVGNEYYPDVLATMSFSAPTGDSEFLTALNTPGSNLGEGFWSTTSALTFIQTYDPLVFFYGAGLRYRFQEKFEGAFKVKPGLQAFYSLGVGFAVTPNVTLSAAFNGSFISEFEVNGEDVGGSAQEPMLVRLAATINKRRPAKSESCLKVVEPFVSFGLNDDAIDTVVGITWTY